MAREFKSFTTQEGTAAFAKINTTVDVYEGKETGYCINVYFDEATTAKLKKQFLDVLKTAQESGEYVNKKGQPLAWRDTPRIPVKTDDDGKTYVVFKTKHTRLAYGEEVRKYVPVFDAYGKPMGNDVTIGNGSIVKINFSPMEYHLSADNNGCKAFLNAIQVLDLHEYSGGSSAEAFGFTAAPNDYFGTPEEEPDIEI